MNPKIFVSSTIIDFEDLRGAIKYYLEEYGYDVQMSEYPNFNINSEASAIEACIENLINCQYYILLIGYRRGSLYSENLSVTNLEYRAAKTLIERGHSLRILSFVRKPIWLLKNDRRGLIEHFNVKSEEYSKIISETGSTIIDDPDYIFNFLKEISEGIKFPGSDSPANNWIIDFNNFEDIITAIKNTFHIKESLREKRLKRLLKTELENNIKRLLTDSRGIEVNKYLGSYKFSQENLVEYLAKTFYPKLWDKNNNPLFLDRGIDLEKIEATRLAFIYIMVPLDRLKDLETRFLEKIINEGLFLTYNVNKDDFDLSLLSLSFDKLLEWINNFKNIFNSIFYETFRKEMARISTDGSLHHSFINISMESCGFIMGLIYGIRIYDLAKSLLSMLENDDLQPLLNFDFSENYLQKYL
ncbi:MAG: DUF4062 domain-containing protein [Ignavibacteriales bacterium]|nr:DUF4062 domain-containing protein [Ignavibacteriales bacterium]